MSLFLPRLPRSPNTEGSCRRKRSCVVIGEHERAYGDWTGPPVSRFTWKPFRCRWNEEGSSWSFVPSAPLWSFRNFNLILLLKVLVQFKCVCPRARSPFFLKRVKRPRVELLVWNWPWIQNDAQVENLNYFFNLHFTKFRWDYRR